MSAGIPEPSGTPTASVEAIEGRLRSVLDLRSEQHVDERAIVIEHRSPLIYMLCTAAELEHALMCEYLFAAFSLKRSVDEGLTREIDLANATSVGKELNAALGPGVGIVIADMSATRFCDTSGIHALVTGPSAGEGE